jgi:hypothetical protein
MFLQKVHVENFLQKNRQKKQCQVFPRFVLFYRILGGFLAMGLQKHYKKRCAKKSRRKVFAKNRQENPNRFFKQLTTFWGFSWRGEFENTTEKRSKKCLALSLFWPLIYQRTTGSLII